MSNLLKKSLGLFCALILPLMAFAQGSTVRGSIVDASGEPVVGAYVTIQGNATVGTSTDLNGEFSLDVAKNAVLEVSCIGYTTQLVPVNGRTVLAVTLEESAEFLEGTVVIGYGTARKSDVTGSISSVGGTTLREVPSTDVSRALEGRIAGVEMLQTSSQPGAPMQIRIRGQRSLSASNDPLIVLDGIPFMGELSDISPSDIKSLDILKDASSTAIYGSRGSNGVILISTFKGVQGQDARISFNAYTSIKKAVKYPMMGGEKYIKMREMAGRYVNSLDESNDVNTDWQDLLYRTAVSQNYDLSVSGGTKGSSYRFGITYTKDQSVLPTQEYNRLGMSGSLDQKIGDWLRVGFSTISNVNTNDGNQVGVGSALEKSPLVNPYNEDGTLKVRVNMPSDNDSYVFTKEVLERLQEQGTYVNESRTFASYNTAYLEASAPWIKGLSYKLSAGFNFRTTKGGAFTGAGIGGSASSYSTASWNYRENINWTVENLLTFDRTFGKHRINAVGLFSAEQTTTQSQGLSAKNIPNELFQYYNIGASIASDITVNTGGYTQYGLISYMGRIMYSYDDKYMISAAVRSDASSRLAPGHQWHTYPAVSVGWNIHKEGFMSDVNWLDELKIRAGYGETSNQSINPYATLGSLSTRPYNHGSSSFTTGYYVSTLPNTELGWEYSQTLNFGLDYALFNGRLRGTMEYYSVNTNDILLSLGLPGTSGVSSYTANIGKTANKGFEFTVDGTIIDRNDWTWTAGLNIYTNHNELVALADGTMEDTGNCWFVGYPINCLYDYEYDGLWQEGDPYMDILEPSTVVNGMKQTIGAIKVKYHGEYNADGSPVRAISAADRVPISTDPIFAGGMNTRLSYKNFDLNVVGSFQCGGILLSSLHMRTSFLNMLTGRRGQIDVDYWTPENKEARYPRPGSLIDGDIPKYANALGQYDGSYFKIRTITLGYNFHKLNALKKAGISNLRVYATLQNPGIVFGSDFYKETGLDPETNSTGGAGAATGAPGPSRIAYVGFNTPNTRNILFGVNLSF